MAIYSLAHNPQHQARLRDEIAAQLFPFSSSPTPNYDAIDRLHHLDNFLKETLRVYCPLQYIPRQATQDVEVANTLLPKGTIVQLSPALINLHPSIWGPDAETFDPDRWDSLQGEAAGAYAFESFHNGTRMCFGKQLAMMEMKIIIIEILGRFHVEALDPGQPLELASPSFTLRPKERLRVRLTGL